MNWWIDGRARLFAIGELLNHLGSLGNASGSSHKDRVMNILPVNETIAHELWIDGRARLFAIE
eukprot:1555089-Karenia_brevis.AAC.1